MWAPLLTAAFGAWFTITPQLFSFEGTGSAMAAGILGPLITGASLLSSWEVLSAARWVSVFASFALLSMRLWLPDPDVSAVVIAMITGFFTLGLSLLSPVRRHRYGGGWSALRRPATELAQVDWN
jgi:hypothetical protein